MGRAVEMECLQEKTGYRSIRDAMASVHERRDGNAIWYCLELVRPVVGGIVGQYISYIVSKDLPSVASGEDLEQAAFEAIIRYIGRFELPDSVNDEDCEKAWRRYAGLVARAPVRDAYARAMGPVSMPDWAIKIASRLTRAMREIEMEKLERDLAEGKSPDIRMPDPRQIAARAGVEYSKVKRFMDTGMHYLPGQRFEHNLESGTAPFVTEGDPSIILTEGQEALFNESMRLLSSKQQYVVSRLYGIEGRAGTHKSIAKTMKTTEDEIISMEQAAMAQLKAAFMEHDLD